MSLVARKMLNVSFRPRSSEDSLMFKVTFFTS